MASLPLACTLTTRSSNLRQNHNIVLQNPTSKLFNRLSNTRTNKPFHLNVLRISAKTPKRSSTKVKDGVQSSVAETELVINDAAVIQSPAEIALEAGEGVITDDMIAEDRRARQLMGGDNAAPNNGDNGGLRNNITQEVFNASDDAKEARETRDKLWKMALKNLGTQIETIQEKIETHFMDKPAEAMPMLKILEDVKSLVDIHNANVGLKKHIPTTDAAMKVAHHFQAYKKSRREDGLIPVDNVKPKKHSFSPMIDMFSELANLLYGQRGDHHFMTGNFGPIREETPPTEVKLVYGEVPSCIRGILIRNGPNPQYDPVGKYGWLDGDGMLHATYFKNGKVTYASRYTKTSRFIQEKITGRPEFVKFGDYHGAFGVFSAFTQLLKSVFVLDMSYGHGVANESIAFHDGMLLALEDFDRPYAIKIKKDGDLETLGVYDFKKKLTHNITPHTKKDAQTGEWFVFGSAYTNPYMTYRVVSPDGSISDPVTIDLEGPTYMHDFGITKNHIIIMDHSFTFSPEAMLKYNDWVYNINPLKKPRFGIRKRDPKVNEPVTWFELDDTFFIYHNVNSWEEQDGKIVLYGCRLGAEKAKDGGLPIIKSVLLLRALVGGNYQQILPELYKYTFDLEAKTVTAEKIEKTKVDYPKINEKYMGRKSRYAYMCEFADVETCHEDYGKIPSIVKVDLEGEPGNRETSCIFGEEPGEKIFGSEISFVPSHNAIEEDDGYLLNYVHDEIKRVSYLYIICAKTMKKTAVLELPNRVPYGFHATFIDEVDLARQRNFEGASQKTDGIRRFSGRSGGTFNWSWTENEN